MKGHGWIIMALAVISAASCGTARRAPAQLEAPVILPLTDSADIARSRERAQAVADSIAQIHGQAQAPPSSEGILTDSGIRPVPEPPMELVDEIIAYAKTFVGVPYRLGAGGPDLFDCSGFTLYVFREFGYDLPHNSTAQLKMCRPVESFSDLKKGDLVFFGSRGSIRDIGHVGIIVEVDLDRGMFRFIHASVSNGVEIQRSTQPYFMMRYIGAGRILPD